MGMTSQTPAAPAMGSMQIPQDPATGTVWGDQRGHARYLTNNLMYQGLLESPQGQWDAGGYTPPARPTGNQQAMAMALMGNQGGMPGMPAQGMPYGMPSFFGNGAK